MEDRLYERYYIIKEKGYIYPNEIMEIRFTKKEIIMYPKENDLLIFTYDEIISEKSTGLKDKTGKLIYEGDVVELPTSYNMTGKYKEPIIFVNGSFNVSNLCYLGDRYSQCEIIGNIHESK